MKTMISKIQKAAEIAQLLITALHESDPGHVTFEQVGLLDGQSIVNEYIYQGEWELAIEHVLYMIHESEIQFPRDLMLELHAIAKTYGVKNYYSKENQESLSREEWDRIFNRP